MPEKVFTIEGRRLSQLPDVQKVWMWELIVPTDGVMNDSGAIDDDLIIRCRSAVIPGRSTEVITSDFMGMKQYFPSRPSFPGSFGVTYEETEDQRIRKAMEEWQQKIYNTESGGSTRPFKRQLTRNITLLMYQGDGEPLEKKVQFMNAWPIDVPDVALSYSDAGQVTYSVTFQYDFWKLI